MYVFIHRNHSIFFSGWHNTPRLKLLESHRMQGWTHKQWYWAYHAHPGCQYLDLLWIIIYKAEMILIFSWIKHKTPIPMADSQHQKDKTHVDIFRDTPVRYLGNCCIAKEYSERYYKIIRTKGHSRWQYTFKTPLSNVGIIF